MGVLARELTRRGHSVLFVGFPDMREKLPSDLLFEPFGADDQPPGSLQPHLDRLSRLGGMISIRRLILDLSNFADTTCRELPSVLERFRSDALLIDQTDSAASLVARAMGIPFANIANALPLNPEPGVPPPVLPWRYDPRPKGLRRNMGGYRVARLVERPMTAVIRRHAERFGLRGIRYADETWSERCQITQCIPGLDFPRQELPQNFHYVGPLREAEPPLSFDLRDDGRPLVFCSFGSLQGSRVRLLRAVSQAAAELNLNLVIAHGGLLGSREADGLPGRPQVHAFVPQRAVLQGSALAVTHAGFNTVLDALSCATPMVALPIAFEQPGTGARLQRAGVAEVLQHRRSSSRIRDAIEKVLGDGSFRANADRLRQEIAQAGGVRRAADLLEQAFGLSSPPAAATMERPVRDGAHDGSRSESR